MTSPDHQSGTERLAGGVPSLRLCRRHHHRQRAGDEPLIPPSSSARWRTTWPRPARPYGDAVGADQGCRRGVQSQCRQGGDRPGGYALYFQSRQHPWDRDRWAASDRVAGSREQIGDHYQRHIGIYAYRAGFIQRYVDWAPSVLEQVEALEQLRVLWYGRRSTWPRRCKPRRWGGHPRPISTRCERCWPVEAGGTV